MNKMSEEKFVQAICKHLDHSIAQLPSEVNARLESARLSALTTPAQEIDSLPANNLRDSLAELGDLPPAVSQRLDLARQQAISHYKSRPTVTRRLHNLFGEITEFFSATQLRRSAGFLATACVVVTAVSLLYIGAPEDEFLSLEDELTLVASAEDFELYENLDFYLWLADNGMPN